MGLRDPLKAGSIIKMPNQGQYIIGEKIGEGGLSLVYAAKTACNGYPVIIKEFFPSEHAHRAKKTEKSSDGSIAVRKGQICPDPGHAQRFSLCLKAFEQEGRLGSAARCRNYQILSFFDCGGGYGLLPRWSEDSCSFLDLVTGWLRSPPKSPDPVFSDLGRIRFALTATGSLLSPVASIHAQGMLHLDITPSNVLWAGSRMAPEKGTALLADFGCSALMADGMYPAAYVLSYSSAYAAPEYREKDGKLTPATDIYSIGRLLAFLCLGQRAFCRHADLQTMLGRLHIPGRCRGQLLAILQKATALRTEDRYASAEEMQVAITGLLAMLPLNPINPDHSSAFTLYSLKAMLEGSPDPHYSWAHELCDRRGIAMELPEGVHKPVAKGNREGALDPAAFLQCLLPEELFQYLWEQVSREADRQFYLSGILAGNYPQQWREELCRLLQRYGTRRLLQSCRTLLRDEEAFFTGQRILFQILGEEGARLADCYYNCQRRSAPYVGLALLAAYALLGDEGLSCLIPSPQKAEEFFFPI